MEQVFISSTEELELELVIDLDQRVHPIHLQLYINYHLECLPAIRENQMEKNQIKEPNLCLLGKVSFM